MEQNFEKLEELIKDDDKIVTVTSFACEAHISIEESKETFEKYVEINKGAQELHITYILNGKKKSQPWLSVSLIKYDNLKGQIELYEEGVKQIIFSIQKAKDLDFNVIALVDPVGSTVEKYPKSGLIIGKNCIKRKLCKKVLPTLPPTTIKGKSTIFSAKQNSTVKSENVKVDKNGADSNNSSTKKANTQGNIANLFNKASQNKKTEQKEVKHPEKKQKTNGGFANFYTKQSSKELQNNEVKKEKQEQKEINADDMDDEILKDLVINEEPAPKTITQTEKHQSKTKLSQKQDKSSDLFDSDTDEEIMKDLKIMEEKPLQKKSEKKQEVVKNKNKSGQKKKKGVNDIGNDKSARKRKRIIVEDDSDSDDIFGPEKSDNEDLIELSDEPESVKVEKKPLPPKNRRRKAVDKTYEDEEGYIVTKTEYVYETPSEDENEPEKKIAKVEEKPKPKIEKKGSSNSEKKGSSNSENDISPKKGAQGKKGIKKAPSGNQPTLMNFFKKK